MDTPETYEIDGVVYKYADDVFKCDDCDDWHIKDEALERLGITEEDLVEMGYL
jgi:hypothetical protein